MVPVAINGKTSATQATMIPAAWAKFQAVAHRVKEVRRESTRSFSQLDQKESSRQQTWMLACLCVRFADGVIVSDTMLEAITIHILLAPYVFTVYVLCCS